MRTERVLPQQRPGLLLRPALPQGGTGRLDTREAGPGLGVGRLQGTLLSPSAAQARAPPPPRWAGHFVLNWVYLHLGWGFIFCMNHG